MQVYSRAIALWPCEFLAGLADAVGRAADVASLGVFAMATIPPFGALPDRLHFGRADLAVPADERQAQVNGRRGDYPVRHIRYRAPRNRSKRVGDATVDGHHRDAAPGR